jgi:AraC-like DNA-binding protein
MNQVANIRPGLELKNVQGFGPWKDFVVENFPWLELTNYSGEPFKAQVAGIQLGARSLCSIRSSPSSVTRTARLADAAEAGYIKLFWPMSGMMEIAQDNGNAVIGVGQATIFDTARPYRIRLSDDAYFAVLMLPYTACPGWQRISQRLCGAPLADIATAQAALGALIPLLRPTTSLDYEGTDNILRAVTQMLSASLHRAARPPSQARRRGMRIELAHRHILEHIGDPSLDANELASALCVSRRTLYAMFRAYNLTPAGLIDEIRMDRCRQMLGDPAQRDRGIAEIALDHGFPDATSFSRWFKARGGVSPSEWRAAALQ